MSLAPTKETADDARVDREQGSASQESDCEPPKTAADTAAKEEADFDNKPPAVSFTCYRYTDL